MTAVATVIVIKWVDGDGRGGGCIVYMIYLVLAEMIHSFIISHSLGILLVHGVAQ